MPAAVCRRPDPADKTLLARYLLREGVNLRFRLGDDAMRPWLPSGSTVCVAPIPFSGLRRYDVVAVERAQGEFVARRVVRVDHGWIYTRGDGERAVEARRAETEILGRIIRVEAPFRMRLDTSTSRLIGSISSSIYPFFSSGATPGPAEPDRADRPHTERGPLCEEETILN